MGVKLKASWAGAVLMLSGLGSAVEIRAYDPARHDRFLDFPSDLTPNPTFYLGSEDWSGFGWSVQDPRKHFTLISPKHFVGARHFRPRVGQQVRFRNRAGDLKTYTIAARHDIFNDAPNPVPSDLFVGEFSEAIPAEDLISVVPIYNLETESDYLNLSIFASGRDSRAGVGSIDEIDDFEVPGGIAETRGFLFDYIEPGSGDDDCHFVSGDSGGPSVVQTASGFALVGIHSALKEVTEGGFTTYTCLDTFLPHYLDRLDGVLAEDGYQVTRWNGTTPDLSLSLSESADPVFSSEGATYTVTVSNSETGELARNLSLEFSAGPGIEFASVSGGDWVVSNQGTSFTAVQGALPSGASTTLTVALDVLTEPSGPISLSLVLTADDSPDRSAQENADVIWTYQSWSAGLSETGLLDDPDGDGVNNGVEFATGRQGGVAEGEPPLAMTLSGTTAQFSFQRRPFAETLGVSVTLQSSTDLVTWDDLNAAPGPVPANDYQGDGFTFSKSLETEEFYRLRAIFPENASF